jgi:hypothetical protein
MSEDYRFKRIERLLYELRYEITRGMIEGKINETMQYNFIVPTSKTFKNGCVQCQFFTRPVIHPIYIGYEEPRLKIVK